jgi:hypothetical protein
MHKSATKYNETICKWCKNKHGASKIIDTFETYQSSLQKNLEGRMEYCNPKGSFFIIFECGIASNKYHKLYLFCIDPEKNQI